MASNPYAPPSAEVRDVAKQDAAPPLWNPNAAVNWSLLFSPAFGAFLHMKNWQALGEPAKAATAKTWAVISLIAIVGLGTASALLPDVKLLDGLSRSLAFILLIAWYIGSAREQARYVKDNFGKTYPRRTWGKPLLIALAAFAAFIVVVAVIAFAVVGVAPKA